MEKLKSNLQNMVGVLVGVALICGLLLAYVNNATKAAIDEQAALTLADGIKSVLVADKVTVQKTDTIKRDVDGKEQSFIMYTTDKGVAVQSTDPNGFGGPLGILVGFDKEGNILGYSILQTAETPGLGAKAGEWFQDPKNGGHSDKASVIGKNPGKGNFTVSKDGGDIDAITASTITSRAFLRAVQQAYNTFAGSADGNTSATAKAWGDGAQKNEVKE